MFAVQIIQERPNSNPINIIALGVGPIIKRAQLVHLDEKRYTYDYSLHLTNDGIFYSLLDPVPLLNHLSINTQIPINNNLYFENQSRDIINQDHVIDPDYVGILNTIYQEPQASIFRTISTLATYEDNVGSFRNITMTKMSPNLQFDTYSLINYRRLYDLNHEEASQLLGGLNGKIWFYFFYNRNDVSDLEFHFTLYIPPDATKLNLLYYQLYRGAEGDLLKAISYNRIILSEQNRICARSHIHVIYTGDVFTVRQVPQYNTSAVNKNVDFHKNLFVAPGYISVLSDNEKLVSNILSPYRIV